MPTDFTVFIVMYLHVMCVRYDELYEVVTLDVGHWV